MKVPKNPIVPTQISTPKANEQSVKTPSQPSAQTETTSSQPKDTSKTLTVKKHFFTEPPVKFPEITDKKEKTPGLGEILGGLGAIISGGPSRSLGPAIEHGDKELQKRRAPEKKKTEVKTETATKSIQNDVPRKLEKQAPAMVQSTLKQRHPSEEI